MYVGVWHRNNSEPEDKTNYSYLVCRSPFFNEYFSESSGFELDGMVAFRLHGIIWLANAQAFFSLKVKRSSVKFGCGDYGILTSEQWCLQLPCSLPIQEPLQRNSQIDTLEVARYMLKQVQSNKGCQHAYQAFCVQTLWGPIQCPLSSVSLRIFVSTWAFFSLWTEILGIA